MSLMASWIEDARSLCTFSTIVPLSQIGRESTSRGRGGGRRGWFLVRRQRPVSARLEDYSLELQWQSEGCWIRIRTVAGAIVLSHHQTATGLHRVILTVWLREKA